jgi:GntR family transcriptional regulator/MocR family aminotransferase
MPVPFVLDRAAGAPPLHRQIYERWRGAILSGRFRPGERVPSSRAFAADYGIARITVTAAYEQLLAEGYFETRQGSGTFVSSDLPDEALRPLRLAGPGPIAAPRMRLSRYAARLGDIRRLSRPTGVLDLSNPTADLTRFPFPLWRRLVSRHLKRPSTTLFDHPAPGGHPGLRDAVSRYLSRARAVRCTSEQVIIVSGSQQALDLCARLLLDPGDEAAVEEPGYPGARQLFAAHGAALTTMTVTDSGPSLDRLSRRTRLVHVTPSHQFPLGVSMPLARRLELLEWARSHGAVVVEDDYDSEYRYSGPPLPAMHSLADGAGVIYVGTFSNVMFRGLRLGYLVVPRDLVRPFAAAKWIADRNTAMLEQAALADFLNEGHFDRHVRRMRRLYKRRRDVLLDALAREFADEAQVRGDAAGMHVTVRFRSGAAVRAAAERSGIALASTAIYYLAKPPSNEFIFGFSAIGERAIRTAVRRLASL